MLDTVFFSLIITGVIILLLTFGSTNRSALIGIMIGYSFIAIGLLSVIGYLLTSILKSKPFFQILITILPFLLLISTILYILYLIATYFTNIIQGNITNSYNTFTMMFNILLVLQLLLFFYAISDKKFIQTSDFSKLYSISILLFGILNTFIVITLGIMLSYFSTDG
jgi:hypothetical protein